MIVAPWSKQMSIRAEPKNVLCFYLNKYNFNCTFYQVFCTTSKNTVSLQYDFLERCLIAEQLP